MYLSTFCRQQLIFWLSVLFSVVCQAQTIRYVSTTGTNPDPASATSWANSTTNLQGAINASVIGDQVWVAQGIYKPTTSTGPDSRTVSFSMKAGVTIYGGFPASGNPVMANRNPVSYATVLSGDIDNDGQLRSNSYHVISNNFSSTLYSPQPNGVFFINLPVILDGFTITGGNANGDGNNAYGGGILNTPTNATLRNCIITGNAGEYGGGVSNTNFGSATLINCIISNNSASGWGGGVSDYFNGFATLINCIINNNTAQYGGGVYTNNKSGSTLTNCVVNNNVASVNGGGIYSALQGSANLVNCTLTGNSAVAGGAASSQDGGGTSLQNSIAWNNGGQQAFYFDGGGITGGYGASASYSLIEAGASFRDNGNNLTATSSPFVSSSNLQLSMGSPAIDHGNNQLYSSASGPANDAAGNIRIVNSVIDIGAYEYGSAPLPVRLVTFSASRYSDLSVGVEWKTSQEINSDYFDVQRSLDAQEFISLGQVKAQGNSSQQQSYRYIDNQPLTQISYYRLRMVDVDGSVAYSKIVAVTPLNDQALLRLVENPVRSGSVMRVWVEGYQPSQIQLYQLTGQAVSIQTVPQGDGSLGLVTGEHLAPGHYIISAWDGTSRQSQRVVVN